MKTIQIKRLSITNFKGIVKQSIDFKTNTDIFGANGTGKTTIYDAFLWVLFGKNAEDKKDFSIKNTIDLSLNRQEHEVEAVLVVDGESNTLKRIYKEKWQKKRGEETAEYTGNETLYYWNEVPMQQKEFQTKLSNILDEPFFKLISNTNAFNDLKWQERRNVLIQMSGELTNEEIAKGNPEFEALIANLTQGKTMEDYQKQIVASVKKAKDDLKAIPTRIDEISKSKPEVLDFESLKADLGQNESKLKNIDEQLADANKAFQSKLDTQKDKRVSANSLKAEIESIEQNSRKEAKDKMKPDTSVLDKLNSKLKESEASLESANNGIKTLNSKVNTLENEIKEVDAKIENKRNDWTTENAKELSFDNNAFCCPTCKRDFEASDVEAKKTEMQTNFKTDKQTKLTAISTQGKSLSEEKTSLENELSALKVRIENGKTHIESIQKEIETAKSEIAIEADKIKPVDALQEDLVYESVLSMSADYKAKKTELETLVATIEEIPEVDNSELVEKRKSLVSEIDEIKAKLQNEKQINLVNERIEALQKEENTLSQQIANVEKTQFAIERFEKMKMEALEEKVNAKFKIVKFRMFESQVNGGESPACEILVNGVPFSDANTASRINAGIDIISTLCEYYQVSAPIFIDGAESIHDIIGTESQLIRLVVSKPDKSLRVA
jgi:exonuclease SbcC